MALISEAQTALQRPTFRHRPPHPGVGPDLLSARWGQSGLTFPSGSSVTTLFTAESRAESRYGNNGRAGGAWTAACRPSGRGHQGPAMGGPSAKAYDPAYSVTKAEVGLLGEERETQLRGGRFIVIARRSDGSDTVRPGDGRTRSAFKTVRFAIPNLIPKSAANSRLLGLSRADIQSRSHWQKPTQPSIGQHSKRVPPFFETVRFGHSRIPPSGSELVVYTSQRPGRAWLYDPTHGCSSSSLRDPKVTQGPLGQPYRACWQAGGSERVRRPSLTHDRVGPLLVGRRRMQPRRRQLSGPQGRRQGVDGVVDEHEPQRPKPGSRLG